jgi:DNA (cytosine-5)-methyltransferase 1
MNHLSLFSGIGGIDLAAHWAGMKTVAFCEREPFCQKVLAKHWPNIPIYDDVCTLTKERLDADGIGAIDIISAGYPCQPESYVGQRRGAEDDRWLWPEVGRLLRELRPPWFLGENVSGHITMGLDTVLDDLERLQYTAQAFHIPTLAVDGDHERYRVFIVSHANNKPRLQKNQTISALREKWNAWKDVGGSDWRPIPRSDWNVSGPPVSRSINGIPDRMDRCRALGNAVVPQQIYPILKAIYEVHGLCTSLRG